jgi:hypothetical protein
VNDAYTMFVAVRRETAKALLVERLDRDLEEYWVPRSQIRNSEVCCRGDCGHIEVTRWWAGKAGLLDAGGTNGRSTAPAVIELTQATRTYRQLAQQHHPDRAGGDGKTMQALNVLWDAVKNDIQRAAKPQ